MPEFRVTELHGTADEWSTKDGKGPFVPYRFKVEGQDKMCEWSRKKDSPGPVVGDVLVGDLTPNGDFPLKFRKAAATSFQAGGRSPEERKAIVRQHSQEMALRYVAIQAQRGKVPDDFAVQDLKGIVDWFVRDAES